MPKMLIADDNKQIVSILTEYAKKEGYKVWEAWDGEQAIEIYNEVNPDVILLDVMMPKLDGFAVCRELRRDSDVPIIMITARGEDFEKIMGLDTGADDYIVKPFSPAEVMARVRAVLRRLARTEGKSELACGSLSVSLDEYKARVGDKSVNLTKKEFELLFVLVSNVGKVFSRDNLLDSVWGYDYYGDTRTVDSHIKRLRAKLDTLSHPDWEIKTIWGVGYKLEAEAYEEQTGV